MSSPGHICPSAPVVDTTVHTRTLHRACEALGGVQQLAAYLGVSISALERWLKGVDITPPDIFLICVDIVERDKPGKDST